MIEILINHWRKQEKKAIRDGFGKAILNLGKKHQERLEYQNDKS